MRLAIVSVVLAAAMLSSCAKKDVAETPQPAVEAPGAATPASGPHAVVQLNDGSKVPGTIVASTQTDMTVAGDDGIERKIPLTQVRSVQYGESRKPELASRPKQSAPEQSSRPAGSDSPLRPAAPPAPVMTTRTYELPVGSDVSVRTNEAINSGTASEGQTFDAEVTRDAKDVNGDIVIPRGSNARIVIKSASKGGKFHGASDLVLDLQTVSIDGRLYSVDTAEIAQKGKSGVGANKRTAKYGGGGAALGAIIGAIAGGGKGAAIGAGAGAGAGVLTEVLTKGGSIKVPAESVLTFSLDKPLRVRAAQ
jgi:hypothetical protein